MTDQTSENSSEPMTNESLGVVGAQQAQAEALRTSVTQAVSSSTAFSREDTLALEALSLANRHNEPCDQSVARAKRYLDFLKGKDNG